MSTQYLVDYENVHEAGLYGIHYIIKDDTPYRHSA